MPESPSERQEFSLLDYLRIVRRRAFVVVLSVAAIVGAVVVLSLRQHKVYRAESELLLESPASSPLPNRAAPDPDATQTEIRLIESPAVREVVEKRLPGAPSASARQVGTTHIVNLSAEDRDPRRVAAVVNAYGEAYIKVRNERRTSALDQATQQIQRNIADVDRRIRDIDTRIAFAPAAERENVASSLRGERDALVEQRASFRQRLDELNLDASVASDSAQVVKPAVPPKNPVRPNPVRNGLVALGVGLLLGLGLAFLLDDLDDSIKTAESLERSIGHLPVLGHIPDIETKGKGKPGVVSLMSPASPAAEAYRSLRTAVQFLGLERPLKMLHVTSPAAAEGKTTTVANLAAVLARASQRVLIIDCDLRRPRVHEFFDLPNDVGFTSVLLGEVGFSSAVQPVPGEPYLSLLASGPIPPNPSELLASQAAAELLANATLSTDVVLIDSPPIMPVTDATVVARWADATLLVVMAGLTTRKRLQRAIAKLAQVDARLVGSVFNRATHEADYGYGYPYSYSRRDGRPSRRRRRDKRADRAAARP